jgi:hypothetical protein
VRWRRQRLSGLAGRREYYLDVLPAARLAVGLYPDGCTLGQCQRPPPSWDESTGRAWAFGAVGVEEAWVWLLPVANAAFFGPMRRWKTACAACAVGSCWEARRCPQHAHAPHAAHRPLLPDTLPPTGSQARSESAAASMPGPARPGLGVEGWGGTAVGAGTLGEEGMWVAGAAEAAGAVGAKQVWWKARVALWEVDT